MTKNSFKTQVGGDKTQSYYALHKLGKENRYSLIKIILFKYLHQECGISKGQGVINIIPGNFHIRGKLPEDVGYFIKCLNLNKIIFSTFGVL